jgi:hypothetical protein
MIFNGENNMNRKLILFVVVFFVIAVFAFTATQALAIAPLPQCTDNIDNDGDGKIDYPIEPDCAVPSDNSEAGSTVRACSNGVNSDDVNDGDTLVDYPADPGCTSASDNDESNPPILPACGDNMESDGDAKIDLADPGCISASDPSEQDTACSDKSDNDGDGLIDFPADWGCSAPAATANGPDQIDTSEDNAPICNDGRDNDGDGKVDYDGKDLGCSSASDTDETDPPAPVITPRPPGSPIGSPNSPGSIPGTPAPAVISPTGEIIPSNPLTGQGHTHNGSGAAETGKLTAGFRSNLNVLKPRGCVTPGRTIRLRGRLLEPSNIPIANAALHITSLFADGHQETVLVHTRKNGTFFKTLKWGQSRKITVAWYPWGDAPIPVLSSVRLLGAAKVTLHVKIKKNAFRFSGSVFGITDDQAYVQVRQFGRWVLASRPKIDDHGKYYAARKIKVTGLRSCFRGRYISKAGSFYAAGASRIICRTS